MFVTRSDANVASPQDKAPLDFQEQLSAVLDAYDGLICVAADESSHLYVNRKAQELTGYTREELLAMGLTKLLPEDQQDRVLRRFHDLLAGEDVPQAEEMEIVQKDGARLPVEISATRIFWRGKPASIVFARDITQRKKMEQAFSSRAKELNCLLQITELAELHRGSMEDVLQKIADLLPGSWQHADVACGRIVVRDRQYASRNFRRSPWGFRAEIMVDEQNVGCVEMYYRQKTPLADEGPFTREERRLLNAVAERLSGIVRRVEAEHELYKERQALRESNIAMRELMARIQEEKREVARAMQNNVDTVILPILEDLYHRLPKQHRRLIDVLRFNLEEVTSPFVDRISQAFQNLSPAELRVCDMIRRGLSSKEIAHVLHISPSTVSRHREHIRQKLGLTNKGTNLASHLNAMLTSQGGNEE